MQEYRTVLGPATEEIVEKRSRFIGLLQPVVTAEQANERLQAVRAQHYDARHTVFAYRLHNGQVRCSDDGEPQGSAGGPVLHVLEKENLEDCLISVTRYFGGILLGTGGLARAYSQAASLAVRTAKIVVMQPCVSAQLICSYQQYGRIQSLVAEEGGAVTDTVFEADVTLSFFLLQEREARFRKALTDLTGGTVEIQIIGEEYRPKYE